MSVLRDRAVGRALLAVVVAAASVAFTLASVSAFTSSEAAGSAGASGAVGQASSEVGLIPPAPRLSVANLDASTPDQVGVGLFAVLVTGAAIFSLPARRDRTQHIRSLAGHRLGGSSQPRAPPVAPAV